MSFSEAEARIRRLMARLALTENRTAAVQDKILRTQQGAAGFFQVGADFGRNTCPTTLTGTINGCASPPVPLSNATVRFVGHDDSHDYGTFPAPSGVYNVVLDLPSGTTTKLDVYVKGPGTRWLEVPAFTSFVTPTLCGTSTLSTTQAMGPNWPSSTTGIASGYAAHGQCNNPLATSLNITDSRMARTGTLTYGSSGTDWRWIVSGTDRYLFRNQTSGVQVDATVALVVRSWVAAWITSKTCPDGGSTKFDMTLTWAGLPAGPYVAGDTLRIWEP